MKSGRSMSGRDQYLSLLEQLPLFRGCSTEDLRRIGRFANPVRFQRGQLLFDKEVPAVFCVVLMGHLTIAEGGSMQTILGPGGHFGEDHLLAGCRTSLSALALDDGQISVMDKREFGGLLRTVPEVAIRLLAEALVEERVDRSSADRAVRL